MHSVPLLSILEHFFCHFSCYFCKNKRYLLFPLHSNGEVHALQDIKFIKIPQYKSQSHGTNFNLCKSLRIDLSLFLLLLAMNELIFSVHGIEYNAFRIRRSQQISLTNVVVLPIMYFLSISD